MSVLKPVCGLAPFRPENGYSTLICGKDANTGYVSEKTGARHREIADALDLKKVMVSHHVNALVTRGLVGYERGNAAQYFPMPTLEAGVRDFGPCYRGPWKQGGR